MKTKQGYVAVNEHGQYMHDMIAERILGRPLPKGTRVEHIDGNGSNNTRANLRIILPSGEVVTGTSSE